MAATGPTRALMENTPTSDAIRPTPTIRNSQLYQTREVVRALGLSRRQLQYWAKTGLVVPSVRTPGGHHRYSFADLIALKTAKRLIDAGVSLQRIRRSIEALAKRLPTVDRPLDQLVIIATGDVLVVFDRDSAFEPLSGQEWIFEVAQFRRELEGWDRKQPAPAARRAQSVRRGATDQRAVG